MYLYKYKAAVRRVRKNLKELQHQSVDDQVDLSVPAEGGVVAEDVGIDEEGDGDEDEEVHMDKDHVPDMTTTVPVSPHGAPIRPL